MLQSIQLWLPRILTLLQWICGLGIAYVIANTILMMVGGGADSSRAVQSPAALTAESRALPPAPTLAALTKRDLFGHTNATNLSRSSAPAVPTRLPLTLEAVFVSSAPEESSAIISERGKRGKLYGPGDQLPGNARLYKVEPTQVILSAQVRGRHLRLSPNSKRKPVLPHSLPGQRQLRRLQQEQRRRFFNNLAQNSRKILMPRWNDWVSVGTVAAAIESATSQTTPI